MPRFFILAALLLVAVATNANAAERRHKYRNYMHDRSINEAIERGEIRPFSPVRRFRDGDVIIRYRYPTWGTFRESQGIFQLP